MTEDLRKQHAETEGMKQLCSGARPLPGVSESTIKNSRFREGGGSFLGGLLGKLTLPSALCLLACLRGL